MLRKNSMSLSTLVNKICAIVMSFFNEFLLIKNKLTVIT